MSTHWFHKTRIIWLITIVLLSLGLVGGVLAAASSTTQPIQVQQATPPQAQGRGQASQPLPPSPYTPITLPDVARPVPDTERMRQQALAAWQAETLATRSQRSSDVPNEVTWVNFWQMATGLTWLSGVAGPFEDITITTSTGLTLYGTADMNGNFNIDPSIYLSYGDVVTATAGLGQFPAIVEFPEMKADSDSAVGTVSGHLSYNNWEVTVYPWWNAGPLTTNTDNEGNFSVSYGEIPGNGKGFIEVVDSTSPDFTASFERLFYDLEPYIMVDYGNNYIDGMYDAGYQVWITLTNELGEIKGTVNGVTGAPGWQGDTGFATWSHDFQWDGLPPDIEVGDKVYVVLDNGRSAETQVGAINGTLDVVADTVEGTLDVPWLTDPVRLDCNVYVPNGPMIGLMDIDPQGGAYACDFSLLPFDLLPGMSVGVKYFDPDNNEIVNRFYSPAPDLRINTWGQSTPASGNNYVLEVHYNNDGWLAAPDVTIQQSFTGMEYISDTSGFSHTGSGEPGDPIVWQVGSLPYSHNSERRFIIFLKVTGFPGELISTTADIATNMEYYQDYTRLHNYWEYPISETSESDLSIGMGIWTGAPAAGQDFVYSLSPCNNNGNSSTQVYITDTLPALTTLVDWWADRRGWEVVVEEPNQLVVTRPTLSGNDCSNVFITVHLSDQAEPEMTLHNEASIWAGSDPDLANNSAYLDQPVGWPNYNLHLFRNWVQGVFVPGGEIRFEFNVQNWGNMPMPGTLVTATLPVSTTFLSAYAWTWDGSFTFTPTVITDEYLVWDVGSAFPNGDFPNGYNFGIGIVLKISPDAAPATPLVMQVNATGDALEYRYDDNSVVYNETVNVNGPNLRVDKHTNYNWWAPGVINYELRITNIGTRYLENVLITDTYPISTTFGGCWWGHGPGNLQDCTYNDATRQAVFKLDYMSPGDTASAGLNAGVVPEYLGVEGLAYTNQADISNYDDITPADNHDEVTSYTGQDLFTRKVFKEGEVKVGELVTYTIEFGDLNNWPWTSNGTSHIIDTLPEGMTFFKAIGYWDPTIAWGPASREGQKYTWVWGPMWGQQTWTFDLVARVGPYADAGTLRNTVEAWRYNPAVFDLNPENNVSTADVELANGFYRQLLPLTQRTP